MLGPALRSSTMTREDELAVRSTLAEAWLLQDDLDQAAAALGRPPTRSATRSRRAVSRRSGACTDAWRRRAAISRARSRCTAARSSRRRSAHDSRAIGLAHYELGQCYRQVGDMAIVREHITKAGVGAARRRRSPPSRARALALRRVAGAARAATTKRWWRCARPSGSPSLVHANDVLATVCGNQANVTMLQHRYEQALALAERSVSLHEDHGPGTASRSRSRRSDRSACASAISAAPKNALHRALDVRSPIQFHETTGAVFDTLAQIHLMRGRYDTASEFLARASEAYGAYGRETSRWYEWSVRVLGARLALRRGELDEARRQRGRDSPGRRAAVRRAPGDADRRRSADGRRSPRRGRTAPGAAPPMRSIRRVAPAAWGEYLRLRGALARATRHAPPRRITTSRRARRCSICSANATRRRSAISRSAGSSPRPARDRSPSVISTRRSPSSSSSAPSATSADTRAAQRC